MMANVALKSIKFPGLTDTYTVPQIDSTLAVTGKAADAKAVGDALGTSQELFDIALDKNFGIEQATLWDGFDDANATAANMARAPFLIPWDYDNSFVITKIKLKVSGAGTVSVGYLEQKVLSSSTVTYDASDVVVKDVLSVASAGVAELVLQHPFVVPSGCMLAIGQRSDVAFYYGNNGSIGFYAVNASNNKYTYVTSSLGISVYGLPVDAYKYINDTYLLTKGIADVLKDDCYTDISISDGYDALNDTSSTRKTAPFLVAPVNSGYVTAIKLNVKRTGTFTIGTIKNSDFTTGQPFDDTKIRTHEVMYLKYGGEQTVYLHTPMKVEQDDYMVVYSKTDNSVFAYGSNGTNKRFYYISATGKVASSANSVGITFYGIKKKDTTIENSVYNGKKLSILGDSISTFSGYIPEGNATYYPAGSVQAVTDTWWDKLRTALGMELEVNNSWSGSRVTTTSGDASAGCMTRCEDLGTAPDVIIVWMGINDFNNEVAIGTYDGKTALPATTTTFREAYAIMLNKILTKYQTAEVWVCTLPQCERNAESGFPEINGNGVSITAFNDAIVELANAFGVKVLEHAKCGLTYQNMPTYNPDNLHPNKLGHSLVVNNDIRQMDNYVRARY